MGGASGARSPQHLSFDLSFDVVLSILAPEYPCFRAHSAGAAPWPPAHHLPPPGDTMAIRTPPRPQSFQKPYTAPACQGNLWPLGCPQVPAAPAKEREKHEQRRALAQLRSERSERRRGPGAHNGQRGGRECEMKREEGEAAGLLGPRAHPSAKPVRPARRDKPLRRLASQGQTHGGGLAGSPALAAAAV